MRRKQKAFTLVELLTVIAITAILATVGYLGYNSFVTKQELSNDNITLSELNVCVHAACINKDINTVTDVANALKKDGFDLTTLKPSANGYCYGYDVKNQKFCILDSEYEIVSGDKPENNVDLFVFVVSESDRQLVNSNGYSAYLMSEYGNVETIETTRGIDVGVNVINQINYVRNGETDAQHVVIYTNYDDSDANNPTSNLTINGYVNDDDNTIGDSVSHYGKLNELEVTKIATNCYYEYGHTKNASVALGKIVIMDGGVIDTGSVGQDSDSSIIVYEDGEVYGAQQDSNIAGSYELTVDLINKVVGGPILLTEDFVNSCKLTDATNVSDLVAIKYDTKTYYICNYKKEFLWIDFAKSGKNVADYTNTDFLSNNYYYSKYIPSSNDIRGKVKTISFLKYESDADLSSFDTKFQLSDEQSAYYAGIKGNEKDGYDVVFFSKGTIYGANNATGESDYVTLSVGYLTNMNIGYLSMVDAFDGKDSSILTNINFENFNATDMTDMSYMLYGNSALKSFNNENEKDTLSKLDTSIVTNFKHMFHYCKSLTSISLGTKTNTDKTHNTECMFSGCSNLLSVSLPYINTLSNQCFYDEATGKADTKLLIVNAPNCKKIGDKAFYGCTSLKNSDETYGNTNLENVEYIGTQAFNGCTKLTENPCINATTIRYNPFGQSGINSLVLETNGSWYGASSKEIFEAKDTTKASLISSESICNIILNDTSDSYYGWFFIEIE